MISANSQVVAVIILDVIRGHLVSSEQTENGVPAPRLTARMARVVTRLSRVEVAPSGRTANNPSPQQPMPSAAMIFAPSVQAAAAKRAMDILISGLALAFLSPLFIMIALMVRVTMGSGVLFSQARVGRHGRSFGCLKFRTMICDAEAALVEHLKQNPQAKAEWEASRKLQNDPRVTPLGRFLRKSSLDELPQLINVLIGDMSCVGPRPVVPSELTKYGDHAVEYLSVRPGVTGLWQVSGRSRLSYADRVALDADYVRHWSLSGDILILLKTVPAVTKFGEAA